MSEEEAKALAAELAHHRYWCVRRVYENPPNISRWPDGWIVQIEHRQCTGECLWIYSVSGGADDLAKALNEHGRYYADVARIAAGLANKERHS